MYTFEENIDYKGFFCLNKEIIADRTWAKLSLSGKAILPVLLRYRNEKGIAFPSLERIAILAGVSEKTASWGVKNIVKYTEVELKKYRTTKGNISYQYFIPSNMIQSEARIRINNALFDSGCWRMLSLVGKALYMVLLALAEPDKEDYEINELDDFNEWYSQREYDIVKFKTIQQLIELTGISRPSINNAANSLKEIELLADGDEDTQKIYIIPETYYYDSVSLNLEVAKSFKHKQKKL